jgi:hypothetical protein
MKQDDRRKASTDARIELRKQAVRLRAAGKTLQGISEITGYYALSMTIELALLAGSVVLGIVHIIVVSHLQSWQ